jgi:hypothetical protein
MHRNGFWTQIELRCDFLGGLAFAKEQEDLELSVAEFFQRRAGAPRPGASEGIEQAGGETLAHVDPAAEHASNGRTRGAAISCRSELSSNLDAVARALELLDRLRGV